jgi:predicted phage terminase large subunit-like protein
MNLDNPEIQELLKIGARQNFWIYCNYIDGIFFQKRKFLKECAYEIQNLYDGKIKRLSISLPPRAGKSYLATLAASYFLGRKPEESVMRNSATGTLYNKFSYDVRDVIKSQRFRNVFPDVTLAVDKQAVTGWNLQQSKQVGYYGAGTGGTIIGFGASALSITDDLYKGHEDALSETINDKVHRWFESAHLSRLEKGCVELDIGTRWSKNDVIGARMERGDYDISVVIPALINGETFSDEVKTTEEYEYLKSITDPFIWDSEYMQEPVEAKGLVFPASQLKYYTKRNTNRGYRIAFIDTADGGSDYFSMPTIEFYKETGDGYLIDVMFNLDNLTLNEAAVVQRIKDLDLDYLVVETNKEGTYFINKLKRELSLPIYGQFNSTNKITRIISQSGFITQHIYFKKDVKQGTETQKFMTNLTTYLRTGTSKHDDAPDSLSGAIRSLRTMFSI